MTTMATVMSAVAFDQFGGPEVLGLREVPMPSPAPGEVRIRVLAVSVGRTIDLETRAGKSAFASAIRLPHIPGAEHAGVVDLVGAEVTSFLPGQLVAVFPVITCQDCPACATGRTEACARMEIIGIHRAGAYALYSCVPAANVFPVTGALDAASAAALALNGAVALRQLAVAEAGHGTTVLVHGAGGALGLAVVRAALLRGARVIASARQPWKRERLRTLGADLAVDPDAADFSSSVRNFTGAAGVDIIVDNLANPSHWAVSLDLLARHGTVVTSGALCGDEVPISLRRLYLGSQRIIGVRTARLDDARDVWAEVRRGLRAEVDDSHRFSLHDAAQAHAYLASGQNFGRVVLDVASGLERA